MSDLLAAEMEEILNDKEYRSIFDRPQIKMASEETVKTAASKDPVEAVYKQLLQASESLDELGLSKSAELALSAVQTLIVEAKKKKDDEEKDKKDKKSDKDDKDDKKSDKKSDDKDDDKSKKDKKDKKSDDDDDDKDDKKSDKKSDKKDDDKDDEDDDKDDEDDDKKGKKGKFPFWLKKKDDKKKSSK